MSTTQQPGRRSDRTNAMMNKTAHAFKPGLGYLRYDAPPAQAMAYATDMKNAMPPAKTKDGALCYLKAPNGRQLLFTWVAREQAWERPGGNRMAWTAAYLAAHGWRYVGAAA